MNNIISQKKFLVTLLTSSNSSLLKLSYDTIINQLNHYLDYTIVIVVNSLDTHYYDNVLHTFKNIKVEIIQTESNGKPGKGHNSLFTIFKKKQQYDYLIPIDGDDFLYPYAFHQLTKSLDQLNPDILVLQGNDLLSWYSDSDSTTDIYLNNSFYLIKQDEYHESKWKFNSNSVNINPFTSKIFMTPIRLILCSRNIFKLNIDNYYCEKCKVIDDYLFYLHFIDCYINNKLNVYIINSNHIYLYNDLSIESVHNTLKLEDDYNIIKSYENKFKSVIDYFKNKWNVLELPYKYIEPIFSNKFNKYNIENNSLQILNYDEYLNNCNTKYCIQFCKKLVVNIYNIFKSNIDKWLEENKLENVHKLCMKFISNNCSDREIYLFICIYGVLINNDNLVKTYINDSYPLCNNYNFLHKFL